MLWSKAIGAGEAGGGSITTAFVTSSGTSGVQTITIPPLAAAGDVAVIFSTSIVPAISTPTGWTTISSTGASLYNLKCIFKKLAQSDLGTTITVGSPASAGYNTIEILIFRTTGSPITTINIVSLTTQGDTQTKTMQTINISSFTAPNILFSVTSANNPSWVGYSSIYTDSYWDGGFYRKSGSDTKQAVVYEIQNDYNTSRNVNLSSYTSTYQSFHSFALNIS